jgi:O-methyltransferase involved in polyketide biosynthesis
VLTEGVIPYLDPAEVGALAADLLAQPRVALWIAEYFNPRAYRYLQKSTRMLAMKNAPFRFFPADWKGFFRERGWSPVETRYSSEIALETRRRPPMPWWAGMAFRLMPARARAEAMRMTGYMLFERA